MFMGNKNSCFLDMISSDSPDINTSISFAGVFSRLDNIYLLFLKSLTWFVLINFIYCGQDRKNRALFSFFLFEFHHSSSRHIYTK